MGSNRRYDIDWIRVLVFDILIVFHVGMFFVPWDWHIKNDVMVPWLEGPMSFTSYWRIPILFVVSGMGTRFALSSKSGKSYIIERIKRLFIPLVFGMLVIVPPQVYLERLSDGAFLGNFFEFYPHYFDGIYPSGNFSWHHLWFLPYLLLMSIVATPIFLYLRDEKRAFIISLRKFIGRYSIGLYLAIVPLLFIEWSLGDAYPITHALVGDWYALAIYFVLFILGYILICIKSTFWDAVLEIRYITLAIGIISFYMLKNLDLSTLLNGAVYVVNVWSWILTIFGFASKYLNKESSLVKYRNQAVYPFYILHQTITIICGYFLMDMDLHYLIKMVIMILVTFGGSWLIYSFIILKIPILRPLFGVKGR